MESPYCPVWIGTCDTATAEVLADVLLLGREVLNEFRLNLRQESGEIW